MNKPELRHHIRQLKQRFSSNELREKSTQVIEKIESDSTFNNAQTIMAFWSMEDEVFTHDFLEKWRSQKVFLLPVIDGNFLIIKQFNGKSSMRPDEKYGILEPIGTEFSEIDKIDLILVPGVAFDRNKNRMGRGKAFYDRFLPKIKSPKIGICFDFQIVKSVPTDQFDIPMDGVISENIIF